MMVLRMVQCVSCFLHRYCPMGTPVMDKRFLMVQLKSSLRKFYVRDHDLVNSYRISVSPVTMDMFHQQSNPTISSFMTYHQMLITTGATTRAGTAYLSGTSEFTCVFNGGRGCLLFILQFSVQCIVECFSIPLAITLIIVFLSYGFRLSLTYIQTVFHTEGIHFCPVPSDLCVFDSPCTIADIPLGKVVPDSDETMTYF